MVKAKKATKVKTAAKAATTYTLNMANGSSKVVTRKRRIPIAKAIVEKLEKIFVDKQFPQGKGTMKQRQEMMKKLSKDCNLTFEQLRRWFDNRTQKAKRLKEKGGSTAKKSRSTKSAKAAPKNAKGKKAGSKSQTV
jgi:hypothetical protein